MAARWYIIHAYSGFENKVRDAIISEAGRLGLSEGVEEVQVPTETITEVKRGKKVQVERKFMPGYVLAKLNLTGLKQLSPPVANENLYLTLSHKSACNTGELRGRIARAMHKLLRQGVMAGVVEKNLERWRRQPAP